jgi:hypothetical protein
MKEFLLLIRNKSNHLAHFSPEENRRFLKACEEYISRLKKQGNLKAAQPMDAGGILLSGNSEGWKEISLEDQEEVIVGYYHIQANDMKEAVKLAKGNPEFSFTPSARVECRPLKTKEKETGFHYPGEHISRQA